LFLSLNLGWAREVQLLLANPRIAVEIDRASGAVRSIRDKELNSTYAFAGTGFEVTTATGTVRSVKAQSTDLKGGEAVLRFADGGLDVKLHYTLGAEDRFVEKWLETKATDGKPYFLKSVVLEDASTTAFNEIHFHDDQTIWHCPINLFLRAEKGGCFAGLEYPYWELKQNGKEGFRLGYQPNYQAAAGEILKYDMPRDSAVVLWMSTARAGATARRQDSAVTADKVIEVSAFISENAE
jgi:hypothetical protein